MCGIDHQHIDPGFDLGGGAQHRFFADANRGGHH